MEQNKQAAECAKQLDTWRKTNYKPPAKRKEVKLTPEQVERHSRLEDIKNAKTYPEDKDSF